jgi:hypothetical protein
MEEYGIRKSVAGLRILSNEHRLPWSVYIGAAGMPGEISIITFDSSKTQIPGRENCVYGLEGIFTCEEGYFTFHLQASLLLISDDDQRAKLLL